MKKKDIIDLITAHYEDDPRLFFHKTIEILKEFQEDGDKELVEYVSNILKSKVKIAPKREVTKLEDLHEEISFDEAEKLGWVTDFVPQEKSIFEEPAYTLDDAKPKNSSYVAVDYTKDGTVVCRPTNDPKEAATAKELKKLFN